jgi:hypothetical protein
MTTTTSQEDVQMRRIAVLIPMAAVLAVPVALLAHDTKSNKVMGTVTAVHTDTNHIEVKTSDGHSVGVKVDGDTKYTKAGRTASLADMKEGARVVVTTKGQGDARTATLIRLSSATSASTSKASSTHKHH